LNIIHKNSKLELINNIKEKSSNDAIKLDDITKSVNDLNIWSMNNPYNITNAAKGLISIQLIELLKELKCRNITEILYNLVRKIIYSFKILIWEHRNDAQIREEVKRNIFKKNKRMYIRYQGNKVIHRPVILDRYSLWNNYAFRYGGKWLDF